MTRDKIRTMIISLLLKVLGISLFVFVSIVLFTPYLQAATPTYIELEFSDIDYDEAQYIKFRIDADKDFDIVLCMKDNDNDAFYIRYQIENNEDTGDFDKDDNDELVIYLDEDEYVTGYDEAFNSFEHSNSLSFDEYINAHWQKHEYDGGSAELEKIRIFGNEFKLYYLAIDDGDFSDPTWEFLPDEYSPKNYDFRDAGHSYSNTTEVYFLYDYIYVIRDTTAAAGVGYEGLQYPGAFYAGYTGYGYSPWSYYGGNTGYVPLGGTYGFGYQQSYSPNYGGYPNYYPDRYAVTANPQNPYSAYTILPTSYSGYYGNPYNPTNPLYGTVAPPPISLPSGIMNMMASSNWNTAQMGIELSRPYFQAAVRSGWTPWSFPSGFQPYYGYGGSPWG